MNISQTFSHSVEALGTCPDPSYQISPPAFLTEASESSIISPPFIFSGPKSTHLSSTHFALIFYFLLHPSQVVLFLIIPSTDNLLVPVARGC